MSSGNIVGGSACGNFRLLTWLSVLVLMGGGTLVWAGEGDGIGTRAIPNAGVKTLRPAVTVPSQEDNILRQSSPPPRPAELHPPTNAEMEGHCLKNPHCGQKLDQARQGRRPAAPVPAPAAPSQEENILRSAPSSPGPQPFPGPRSHLPGAVERFFSSINPFDVDAAWAQTPLVVTFTPDSRFSKTINSGIMTAGGYMYADQPWYWMFNAYTTSQSNAENKPYIYLWASLPVAGYYMIDIVSSPSLAKFRHGGGAILETWDDRAGCGGTGVGTITPCHHVSVEYYTAGNHYWYFWADPTVLYTYFFSITLRSYP